MSAESELADSIDMFQRKLMLAMEREKVTAHQIKHIKEVIELLSENLECRK